MCVHRACDELSTLHRNDTAAAPPLGRKMRFTVPTRQEKILGTQGCCYFRRKYSVKFGKALPPTKGAARAARPIDTSWMRRALLTRCTGVPRTGRRGDSETSGYLRWILSSTVLNGTMKRIGVHNHYDNSVFACQKAEANQSAGARTRLACDSMRPASVRNLP